MSDRKGLTGGRAACRRRDALRLGLAAMAGLAPLRALAHTRPRRPRRLRFYNLHTSERLETVFWEDGHYVFDALAEIDLLLRDFRTGEVRAINTGLLDLLFRLGERLETSAPFHVVSGYRSAETNAMLHRAGRDVARNSLHVAGMAIDLRVPGRSLEAVREAAAVALHGGGVGYYPRSDFVHLDVGRVRYW